MIKRISYYFKIIKILGFLSLMTRFAYRLNGIVILLNEVTRLAVTLIFVQIVFSKTASINGWNKPEIFLFYGVFLLVDSIFDTIVGNNFKNLENKVESGTFDLILSKPLNSLFLTSMEEFKLLNVFNIILSGGIICWAVSNLHVSVNFFMWAQFLFVLICGMICYYCIYAIVATFSFWSTKTPFVEMVDSLSTVLKYPLDVFGKFWQYFFTFLMPMIFVVTVPTKVLMGMYDWLIWTSPLVAIILLTITIKFWNIAVKKYSSAGG